MKRILHLSVKALKPIFVTILFMLVAVAIFLNSNFFDSIIQNQIRERLGKGLQREVSVDSVAFNPFKLDIHLNNFRIGNDPRSPEIPFFAAKEIYARVSWRHLLAGRLRIREVRLVDPALHVMFYLKQKGGGNNWPEIVKKSGGKKGGINFIISQLECDNMTVLLDQYRLPLTFSVNDLNTSVEYDRDQNNYVASTSFKNGNLKITHFQWWKFDMKANYRIIGDHVSFERLFLLSPRSKFYMAGEMYNLKKPFFDFHFRSHIDLAQAKEIFDLPPEMSGRGDYHAVYKGTFENFRMQGSGDFHDFTFYNLPIDAASFDLDMNEDWLNISNIQARMFDGSYKGTFAIAPLKGHSIFNAGAEWKNWDGRKLCRFIRMNDVVLPIKGSGTASIRWEKNGFKDLTGDFRFKMEPYEAMSADLAVEAEKSAFNRTLFQKTYALPVANETEFRIEQRQLRNIKSHLQTPYTTADISGTIDFSGEAHLDVTSHTEKIPEIDLLFHYLQAYFKNKPARLQDFWAVKGAADFKGKLDATVWDPFEPRLTGKILAKNVFYHGVPWSEVDGDVMFHSKLIQVYDSDLFLGKARAKAEAKFFLADKERGTPDAMELTASVKDFPTYEVPHAFQMELPVHGSLNATVRLKGPLEELEGRSDFEASNGDLWGEKWDRAQGTVLFFPDSLGLRDITVYVNGGTAQASGDLVYDSDDYNVQFVAERIPVEKISLLKQAGLEMTGVGEAQGSGSGTILKPHLQADVKIHDLTYKGEFYGDVNAQAKLDPETLSLDASGLAGGIASTVRAGVRLDGNLPLQADFDIEKFPLEILTHAYAPETKQLSGLIGGKFQLTGTLRPADIHHVSGYLDMVQLSFFGIKLEQVHPINVLLSDNVIRIKNGQLQGENAQLALTGNIYPKQKGKLDLDLSAEIGLQVLSNWDKNITSSGTATTKVAIAGTLEQPSLTGVMEIKDGFFRHYSFPNSLTEISALVTFKNRNISLQSFQATSSGGKLTAGGSATLKGYAFDRYRFDLYAQQIRVHYPEGLRSTMSGELHLQAERDTSYLTGDVEVLQGVYVRSFEESPDVFGYARVPSFAGLAGAESGPAMNLNIHIHSDGNLLVRNNFANIQSSANLNLIGTIDDPVLVGRLEVVKGAITFQNREYTVARGSLTFSNPYRTEAFLNFAAETRIREYHISLNFNGTFDRIYHDLSSDPPLPKDDIYALLGIGRAPGEFTGVDVSTILAGEEISRFITSPIASPLEKGFRKVFGLQKFQIDPTYVQSTRVATARITLQKDISSDFSFTYSTNLFTAAEEIVLLQYQLTDEIQVTAFKDELARYGVDVLVTKTFE